MGRFLNRLNTSQLFYFNSRPRLHSPQFVIILLLFFFHSLQNFAQAACGGTTRTWTSGAGSTNWNTANNWSGNNFPDTSSEDAIIVSGANIPNVNSNQTIGCLEIQSGSLNASTNNITLSVTGDYFRNLTVNSLNITRTSFVIAMTGTAAQTFENYDFIEQLTIGNAAADQDVTLTKPFILNTQLNFTAGWTGTLSLNADLVYNGGAITVPTGATLVIGTGAKLSMVNNSLTVAGTLKIMPGGSLDLASGLTLTVNSGASLIVAGASGNSGKIQSPGGNFTFAMNGILNANYFLFSQMSANGLNIGATGVVQKLDNGEFHFPPANGNQITIAAASTLPATMNQLGFSNDNNSANVKNINSAYTGTAITINNWTGTVGGNANERADAGNKIGWGSQGATKITVADLSAPANTINQATTGTGAIFAFTLNQAATATNVTSIKISMTGTATASDIDYIELYRDVDANCAYTGGTDTSFAGQVSLTGSPLGYTFTIPSGQVTSNSDTQRACVIVRYRTTNTAANKKSIKFSIQSTNDVVNSQGYAFSDSASPPITTAPDTLITGDAVRRWQGDVSTAWSNAGNWSGGAVPTGTRDCQVGAGTRTTLLDAAGVCQNAMFVTGGSLDFGAVNRVLDLKGGLSVSSGFTFLNPTNVASLTFTGTVTQGLSAVTAIPANVTITNTGAAGNDSIEINGDTTIGDSSGNGGNLTLANGTLHVNAPYTLTVKGNLVCSALAGNVIDIAPGATLKMGNGKTITINNGCTLKMVGTSQANAVVTSDSGSNSYNVVVAAGGTISANYYTFSNLGTSGLNIAGTIDSTNHLQNGTFTNPIGNNGKLLDLDVVVPTNSMDNMTFSLGGSAATGTKNIDTATIVSAGTLTLNNYTGDLAGPAFDNDPTYLVSWLGATNTIKVTQEATTPTPLNAGSTYNMGRFGFQQAQAGASYVNTDITSLKLTLTGTASANDISDVKVYYNSSCSGSGGTLIGQGALSGNPASRTFTFSAGQATVEADTSSPPKRCIYVEYVVASGAVNGNTAGVQILTSGDIANSQNYAVDSTTQPPITLGTAGTIAGATSVTWLGTTSTAWATGANWSTGAPPTSSQSCQIDSSTFNPIISAGGAVCKTVTIGNGTLTINTGQKLTIYGGFTNTGTLTLNGTATLEFADGGVATNQTISSTTTIGSVTFNKTAGSGNVNIASSALTITTLGTISQTFDFLVPSGKNLTLTNGATVNAGTFTIQGGGTVTMGNASTFTVGASGSLIMVGNSSSSVATMTGGSNKFNAIINGTISARYYKFNRLSATGVNIASGASIDVTNHLQDCEFSYPVDNNTTMLVLNRQVPTDTMANCRFDKGGSGATGPKNISTTGVSAGTLTLDQYLGDIAGDTYETQGSYVINWTGGVNTIDITQDAATALGSVTAPSTGNLMGRFAFKQTVPGAGFGDANITSLKLTLKGTAAASDISAVRIYSETDCNSAGGTLIGTGTFSGSPATVTFNLNTGDAVILHHATTPPKVCVYVEYDIPAGATNGNTVGVEINASTHETNDQAYAANPSTSFPVNLGNAIAISGATNTNWVGGTSNNPTVAGNWSAGLPTNAVNCTIPSTGVTNNMLIAAGMTVTCKSVNNQGTMSMTGGTWDVHGDFVSTGTLTHSGGTLNFQGTGNQNFSSGSTIFSLGFGKTAGTVFVTGTNVPITTISFAGGSGYTFAINNGKAATISNSFAVATGKTLDIKAGGTLKMANGTTVTINSGGTLKMVGTSAAALATMTSSGSANAFNVAISGNVEARYYQFDHLNTTGVNLTGATINATNHFQDGNFLYPVNNNTTLFKTNVTIPTNTMDNCKFDKNGSAATGTKTVDVSGVASSGTTTLNSWTGDLGGANHVNNGTTHTVVWAGGLNTINITREAASPANVTAGSTYNMGRFGFQQTLAGAGYQDTDITSLKLSATGTATAADISAVRIYYDSDCDGLAGTLIGSGAFTGSPLTKTFSLSAGDATIPMHATAPPKRCIYVEMDIAAGAVNGNTISAKINASADFVNSQSYTVASALPVTLATTPSSITGANSTTWTGTTNTVWETSSNWTNGVPDSTKSCTLVNVTNDPVITATNGICKNLSVGNGVLTINTGRKLQVYGNYDNTGGTITLNGTGNLELADGGTGTTQTVSSTAPQVMPALTFAKTGNGTVRINSNMTLTTPTFPASQAFTFLIPSGSNLTTSNSFSLPSGTTFEIAGGGTLTMANTTTLTVSGGTFKITGTNDTFTQSSANKGKITSSSGTWSFNATSGTVNLTGFWFDKLSTNGLQITGSTNLTNLNGGQFTNLVTNGRGMTLNTTGTVPSTATNVGFQWGAFNAYRSATDCLAGTYYTVFTTGSGCSGNTITFDQWFGNWWPGQNPAVNCTPNNHIQNTACTISMAASASPVSITTLDAIPYNGAVSIEWQTGAEVDHMGFNVYRSQDVSSGYVQINSKLIRNVLTSTSNHGLYRFVDNQVTNGTLYYYMVEDVAFNGSKEKHGPVSATPLASLSAPPTTPGGTNDGGTTDPNPNNGNSPSTGPIATPGVIDLGNGVHILAQTQNSLRLEIIPPPESWSASTWNATYSKLTVPGYASTTQAGYPELVERTLLIEVSSQHSSASIANSSITESGVTAKKVQPAPSWTLDSSNILQPSYAENATAYSVNSFVPTIYYSLDSALKVVSGKAFVSLKVNPFKYHAVNQQVKHATKIILDITLDGAPVWDNQPPSVATTISPSAADGALRMKFGQSGFYEITYSDMVAAHVDGPFAGRDSTNFRAYIRGEEMSIKVVGATSTFSSGDKIRFFVNHIRNVDDDYNEVVLSNYNILGASTAPMRIGSVNADPTGLSPTPEAGSYFRVSSEQDNIYLVDYPLGNNEDHFYWQRIYAERNGSRNPYPAHATMAINLDLKRLNQNSVRPVYLRVYQRARAANSINANHHLGVFVNQTPNLIAEKSYTDDMPSRVDFVLNPNYFFSGTNTIKLRALADMVPPGDWDFIDIDRVEVEFEGDRLAINDTADFTNRFKNYYVNLFGFGGTNVTIYDVSQSSNRVTILNNVAWSSSDGGVTHDATFAALDNSDRDMGTRYVAVRDGLYLSPQSMKLQQGAHIPLKSTMNGADLIVVGEKSLLAYMDRLIRVRETEGLRVVKASLEDVFAEFSNGMATSEGLRDFALYAYNNWTAPKPKYLLIIGDGTYDPRDRWANARTDAKRLAPVSVISGLYIDFGSDNYFVANPDGSDFPLMSVGRIPTSDPAVLDDYITKILAYEAGTAAPTAAGLLKASFVNDKVSNGESFSEQADAMMATLVAARPDYSTTKVNRDLVTDAVGKQGIVDEFNAGPYFMTYIGHGAEDRWASATFFKDSDADALTNTRYPIVMALNCLNGYFYDADPTYYSLGEKLIFNKNGGAIAFWGSTAMTVPSAQRTLTTSFINEFAAATSSGVKDLRLGDIQQRAKQTMPADKNSQDVMRSWVLLGDPSMKVPSGVFKAQTTDLSSSTDEKKGHGFLSCGSINSGPTTLTDIFSGIIEMLVLICLLVMMRLIAMKRLQFAFVSQRK
ncbi:MAG: hypothetical protein A4S09_15375 [Proteobacteria bacterium SG_bin7]|nr:MAG: hypothetical protein A4S09_15375 [Proteobacteria bacterium SG_bin7]